jgi:cyanophycin synthetase
MEIHWVWVLHGPNVWARRPVLEVELNLGGLKGSASHEIPGFTDRLLTRLRTAGGREPLSGDGFLSQLRLGTHLAHVVQQLTLELQSLAGSDVCFGLHQAVREGLYRVVVEYEEEPLARACLEAALALCLSAVDDGPYDLAAKLGELRDLAHEVRLGPSTAAIVRAACRRGIPVRRLNDGSLVQLGHGARQRRVCTAETDRTGAIAEAIAQDKQLTRSLLNAAGVPVPEGRPVANADDAWEAAEEIGPPVVVKPRYGNHGRGVATNLTTREQVVRAYAAALEEGSEIVVERFAPGDDYRLLVIGDRLVAAARREPAQVLGDGRSSIAALVEEVNRDPRRSDGHSTVLSWIKLDAVSLAVLAEQGYTPDSVPPAGTRVLIRRNGNLSTGGTATDVTDLVHPEVAARAVDAARVVGLDIIGVDMVVTDIGRPLESQRGAVVEVNAGPGLRMHLEPSAGKPRPVGEAIVNLLFPEGETGRIPIVAVTGVNGKTTTTRLIAHLLARADRVIAMTCTDGIYVDGRCINTHDCSGPRSARAVLLNPRVGAAVLETARGGILRGGLGFDVCDVAVVTNIGSGDHLSMRGIETCEDLARVKRTVVGSVAPTGAAVLNADDPLVAAMAGHCAGKVVYFARDGGSPVLATHRGRGGRAVFVRDGSVVLAEGKREEVLTSLAGVPLTHQGKVAFQVENLLAAVAAAWCLAVPAEHVRARLATFSGDAEQTPGRFNVFQAGEATVIVDYAHNPSALAALVEALAHFPHRRRTFVSTGCNRRDCDIVSMGEIVGNGFDRVILYEDRGNNDRADGELNMLLRRGLAGGKRVAETVEARDEAAALEMALQQLLPGDLVVIGVESIAAALASVRRHLHGNGCSPRQEPPPLPAPPTTPSASTAERAAPW